MLNSESPNDLEVRNTSSVSPPSAEKMDLLPAAPFLPKSESPSPQHHSDPMASLARLRLMNAAYRWPVPAANDADEYRVRWEGHASHLLQQVARMEHDPASADVTVATKGFTLPAHRIVLAAASKFFSSVLQCVPASQHPVIVVRGADPRHLRCVITFCYTGIVTIPAPDVQQVVKLADDLEISGLKVSSLTGSNSALLSSSQAFPAPAPLRPRIYRPSSPKKFTFTPISRDSPPTGGQHPQGEDLTTEKSYADSQPRKRFKVEPLPLDGMEGGTPVSSSPSNSTTPPGSAPPILPSTSFFSGGGHPNPPNSAPPHSLNHRPSTAYGNDLSASIKNEVSPLSLVSPSRLLEHVPHTSAPPSPLTKKESPSPCTSPSYGALPSTPNSLALALKEPLTPSTPRTPTTPNLHGDSRENRFGNLNNCTTGSRVLLWRFLLDLLHNPRYSPIYIRWLDRPAGIFRIMESDMVAQLWGMARKNSNMNYEKMSRGMRTYYKRGILFHIDGTKLIYKFNTNDNEIQQRMRYYDLTQKSSENSETQSSTNQIPSPNLSAFPNMQNLAAFSNLPVSVTSSSSVTSSMENLYGPLLRDVPQLSSGLLYDPYLTFLRASQRELY